MCEDLIKGKIPFGLIENINGTTEITKLYLKNNKLDYRTWLTLLKSYPRKILATALFFDINFIINTTSGVLILNMLKPSWNTDKEILINKHQARNGKVLHNVEKVILKLEDTTVDNLYNLNNPSYYYRKNKILKDCYIINE